LVPEQTLQGQKESAPHEAAATAGEGLKRNLFIYLFIYLFVMSRGSSDSG
jgi:hypothetical protein